MVITGKTSLYLITGHPVAQVRAPEIFNAVFNRFEVDAVLAPASVSPASLEKFVRHALLADNVAGFWVAIPHKAPFANLANELDPMATAASAVNAIRRLEGTRLSGALFDGIGFVKALDSWGVESSGASVLVCGAGGGGVAIAAALGARGAASVTLVDTAPGKAALTAKRLGNSFPGTEFSSSPTPAAAGCSIVVNASPLGMEAGDPLPFDPSALDAATVVVDIGMKDQPTALLRECLSRGVRAYPGFEMMVQQTPDYLRFFGHDEAAAAIDADLAWVRELITPAEFL